MTMQFSSVVIGLVLLNALILASTTSTTTCGATNTLEKMTNNIQHNYVNITITQISYSLIYKLWNAVSMGAIYRGHTPPLLVTCLVQSSYDFRIFFGELFALENLISELCSPQQT